MSASPEPDRVGVIAPAPLIHATRSLGALQRGDDEARIGAFGEVLGFADNPAIAAPAVEGGVAELLEEARRLAGLGMLGRRGGQVGFELGDQTWVAGQAEDVIDAVRLAPSHQLVPCKA